MKNYGIRFGSGDPRTYTGLSATFLYFVNMVTGATVTPPAIAELFAGTGIYNFQWGATTPIAFLADAATTSPGSAGRYVSGQLDPNDRGDEYAATMIAMSTTITAQNVTLLAGQTLSFASVGSTASSFGTSVADPVDLFGYMKRVQELLEGNETFYKVSGALTMLSRGSSTTLATKTIANSVTLVAKT